MPHPTQEVIADRIAAATHHLSPDDQRRAYRWMKRALASTDGVTRGLLKHVLDGKIRIVRFRRNEPSFTLTDAGRDAALEVFHRSGDARALLARLSGQTVATPPKTKQ